MSSLLQRLSNLFAAYPVPDPNPGLSIISLRYHCSQCGQEHTRNLRWLPNTSVEISPTLTRLCTNGRTPITLEHAPPAKGEAHLLHVYNDRSTWRIAGLDMDNLLAKSGVALGEGQGIVRLTLLASLAK